MKYRRETDTGFEYLSENKLFREDLHCHNRIEILYVRKGKIRLRTDMGTVVYDAYDGDYAVIKCADVHRVFSSSNAHIEFIHFPVSFQNMFENDYIRNSFVIPHDVIEKDENLNRITVGAFSYLSSCKDGDILIRGLCSLLCSVLLSVYSQRRTTQSIGNDSSEKHVVNDGNVNIETMEKFDAVISHINSNFTNSKVNLESLSNISGLNKTFLSALFPRLTGRNFKSYIHYLRINYAIEQLTTTDRNISEIAFSSGFETIRSFNNVFKSVVGTTPSGFIMGLSGKDGADINISINGEGRDLFRYNWTCNVDFSKNFDEQKICVTCNDTSLKLWCHLRLRMIFKAGVKYEISYKARSLYNSVGSVSADKRIFCDFYFRDDITNIEHHSPMDIKMKELDNGWFQFTVAYTVPDYYKPSSDDTFSVYSQPCDDLGVSFEVKDIVLKKV